MEAVHVLADHVLDFAGIGKRHERLHAIGNAAVETDAGLDRTWSLLCLAQFMLMRSCVLAGTLQLQCWGATVLLHVNSLDWTGAHGQKRAECEARPDPVRHVHYLESKFCEAPALLRALLSIREAGGMGATQLRGCGSAPTSAHAQLHTAPPFASDGLLR